MEWRAAYGSKAWFGNCKIRFYNIIILLIINLVFINNAWCLDIDLLYFDKKCSSFVESVDFMTISDDEASYVVGYLTHGEDISENDFNDLLTIVYNLCHENRDQSLGTTLDNILNKVNNK